MVSSEFAAFGCVLVDSYDILNFGAIYNKSFANNIPIVAAETLQAHVSPRQLPHLGPFVYDRANLF